jgi:hypothetical protein
MIITSDYVKETMRARRRAHIWLLVVGVTISMVVSYFVYQTQDWIRQPHLALVSPQDGIIVLGPEIIIKGNVTPGVHLTVNGIDAYSESNGDFQTALLLPSGLHTITVVAENRFGRRSAIERQIVVEKGDSHGL